MNKQVDENEEYWQKELEKCKADPHYFYLHYWMVGGKKPVQRDVNSNEQTPDLNDSKNIHHRI